jgi:hypothetical protein
MLRESTAGTPDPTNANSPLALLLRGPTPSPDDKHLSDVLDFFGIPWIALNASPSTAIDAATLVAGRSKFSILTSASVLAEVLRSGGAREVPEWMTVASSVFVYGFQNTDACTNFLRKITGVSDAVVRDLGARTVTAKISSDFPELCGPMSGLAIPLQPEAAHSALGIQREYHKIEQIVTTPEGSLCAKITYLEIPFFLDASQSILDIHQRAATYFDVKKRFAGAVPLVMYLKWEFRDISPAPRQTNACLIIDDPLLQQRYGFLDFRELLQLMDDQTFTTSIAFIPWNWRRTNRSTVSTFQQNREKLSVCVHGCDHIGGEFSTRSAGKLDKMLKTAKHRMSSLRESTGLHHDEVMVFPQGAFSPEAGMALKGNGFIAAVNTEVAPANNGPNETTIADLWSVAILRYGEFPIFTRRYISHGLENFAFDGLLGKPCFVVGHHELLRDHGRILSEFVAKLKSLNWNLRWRTIGKAVSRSYSLQRCGGSLQLKMFAEHVFLENSEHEPQQVTVIKDEADMNAIKSVTVNGETIDYSYANGRLHFTICVLPGSTAEIRCAYHQQPASFAASEPLSRKAKVAARRYLSEFRDNYLARNDYVLRAASAARRLLK